MPGKVIEVRVKDGQQVAQGDVLFVTESMKMEYTVTARLSGRVTGVHAQGGDMVEGGDLLAIVSPASL